MSLNREQKRELILFLYDLQNGECRVCKKEMKLTDFPPPQIAHLLSDSDQNRSRWSEAIIDHPINQALVCSLMCNNKLQVNYGAQPLKADKIVMHIRMQLMRNGNPWAEDQEEELEDVDS